jgi:hypothetical protein
VQVLPGHPPDELLPRPDSLLSAFTEGTVHWSRGEANIGQTLLQPLHVIAVRTTLEGLGDGGLGDRRFGRVGDAGRLRRDRRRWSIDRTQVGVEGGGSAGITLPAA